MSSNAINDLASNPSQWFLPQHMWKEPVNIFPLTFSVRELFHTQGRVQSDRHVQLSDHSFCCECSRLCSRGHASAAHKRHGACGSRFAASCRSSMDGSCTPAIWQRDERHRRHQVSHYLKVSPGLTLNLRLGLSWQNPLQVTVFCCLQQTTTRWHTISDTLIVDRRRNIMRVGSSRLYTCFRRPQRTVTTATTVADSPRSKACPRHEEDMTIGPGCLGQKSERVNEKVLLEHFDWNPKK